MANGILLKFDASHHAAVVLLVIKSHPGLTKSQWCHCGSCNGMVPTMFFQAVVVIWNVERRSLQQRWLRKNHNSGTATMVEKDPEQRRCSAKKWSCEVVGSQLLSVFSTWSSSVLGKTEDALSWALIIDLTFHGQWHTSQVRCQPPCTARENLKSLNSNWSFHQSSFIIDGFSGWVCRASSSTWIQPDWFFRCSGSLLGVWLCRRRLVFA